MVVGTVLVVIAAALLIPVGPSIYGRERAYYNGGRWGGFGRRYGGGYGGGYGGRYGEEPYGRRGGG